MKTFFRGLAAGAFLLLGAAHALAQTFQPMPVSTAWLPQSKLSAAVTVTTSSAATALPTPGFVGWLCNTGANDIYLTFGTSSGITTTVATGSWLKSLTCGTYTTNPRQGVNYTHVAMIGSGGSSTVYIEGGLGTPPAALAGGGGGGTTSVTQGTTPWVDNITQWASAALGAPSAYGTSPGTVTVPGVNAFVTNTVTVTGPLTDTQLRALAVPISAAALPLPALAATSTKQSDGTQKSQIVDGSGNVIGATSNALDINIKSGNISGFATSALQTTMGTNQTAVQGPVPAGAATATKFNMGGGEYRNAVLGLSNGQQVPSQFDVFGNQRTVNMDAAGNLRGANVNASNQLSVSLDGGTGATVSNAASENHIGEVGGNIIPITNAMTTSNNSITTGEAMGGLQTLAGAVRVSSSLGASGTSGIIQTVMITFKDAITTPWDVFLFNASPTGSTCTDNTTFVLADADRDKVVGVAHITDLVPGNTAAIGQAMNQAIPFGVASATSIFACVVSRGTAAITGTANASLIVRVMRN